MPLREVPPGLRWLLAAAWLVAIASSVVHAQTAWKPDKNVELIVPSAAGGGLDRTARAVQKIWQERNLFTASSAVVNKPGGSGNIGYAYLAGHKGDGHYVSISSPTLLTNHILGTSRMSHGDFTPLAMLSSEYLILSVKADSPLKGGREVIERLKKDPASLSIAIGSVLGGSNHIGIASVLKAAGVDVRKLKTVVFRSGTESVTALMGGHVDLAAGAPEQGIQHVQSGKIRVIGVGAPQRLPGVLSNVPTWKELGVDMVADTWRGIVGPNGLSAAQVAFWDQTLARMVATEDWKKDAEKNLWSASYRGSTETRTYLDAQYRELKAVLTDLGLVK